MQENGNFENTLINTVDSPTEELQQLGDLQPGMLLPPFPNVADGALSPARRVNATQTSVLGDDAVQQGGTGNYSPVAGALVVVPGNGDETAWARYSVSDLLIDRPQGIQFDVEPAALMPVGEDPLELEFYIGFSNFTDYSWEWQGPFFDPMTLTLNSATVLERYISATGVLHFVVLTIANPDYATPENPDGLTAVRVNESTIALEAAAGPSYFPTKPHFTELTEIKVGSSTKQPADLDPDTQYVTLNWTHIADPNNPECEADYYEILRAILPLDPGDYPWSIGTVDAPATQFVDPLDSEAFFDPTPGGTYTYYLLAHNDSGFTLADHAQATIPLFSPPDLQATDGRYTDQVELTWTAAEGATSYKIYRDGQTEEDVIGTAGFFDQPWFDTTVGDFETHTYWVRSTNSFQPGGGQWSTPDDGFAADVGPGVWPQFGQNVRNTCLSPVVGSDTNNIKWQAEISTSWSSAPAIAADGTLYIGGQSGVVYAINPDGSVKWSTDTGNRPVQSSPAIGPSGTVYVVANNGLTAFNPDDGSIRWNRFANSEYSSPAVAEDGTIVVGHGAKLEAFNSDGTPKWTYDSEGMNPFEIPAIAPDGTVYCYCQNSNVYAIDADGTYKWELFVGPYEYVFRSVLVGPDGTIYVGGYNLDAISPEGAVIWSSWDIAPPTGILGNPAFNNNGDIVIGSQWGSIYIFDPATGAHTTFFSLGDFSDFYNIAVDAANNIYVACENQTLYAINSGGSIRWTHVLPGEPGSSPIIGPDGTVYFSQAGLTAFGPD